MDVEMTLKIAANALNSKKARELKIIKIDDLTSIAEYFIIATATSSTHVRSLADEVDDVLKEQGVEPHHIEGRSTGWLVLDYSSVIVHIFTPQEREFYNLDNMWSDGIQIELDKILNEAEGD